MTTTFLLRFSMHLIRRLRTEGLLELAPGGEGDAIAFVADHLALHPKGSLVTEVGRALTAAPTVVEVWADDEQLRDLITDLDAAAARG